jgi:hypothetical protein
VELRSAAPSTNDGSLAYLDVGSGSLTLLRFDLSLLPAGVTPASISRAVLQLYVDRVTTPGSVQIAPVLGPWGESTVTYNTQPTAGSPSAQLSVTQPGTFVAVDVTSLVQSWLSNPAANFGMALSSDSASVQFNSKENEQTSHAATLDIELTDPGATGPQGPPGPSGPQGPAGVAGPAGAPTGIQITGSPSYPGLLWATSPSAANLATPQNVANSLADLSGTSMYLSSANPTAPGPNNVVMGVGAGSHLAFGSGYGGEDSVIIGHDAAHNATSAREDVVIGYQAGYSLTGCCSGGTAEDSVVVLVGSLAGAAIANKGLIDTVMIGQKAGISDMSSGQDTMIGNHVGTGIVASNSDTLIGYGAWAATNSITSDYDTIVGSNTGGNFPTGYSSLFNTGVGFGAFSSMGMTGSGGQYNTAIGAMAGSNITSGMLNTCIGIQACGTAGPGLGVMTGTRNLYLNTQQIGSTTASNNFVAMDGNTLTTGNENVIISQLAQVRTGSGNVCLGIAACQFVNGTEGNIVALGYGANVAPGVSNAVELGNGSNSQPSTLAFDGFSFLNTSGIFTEVLSTPASSSAPCTPGQFTDDANYHYVCTAPNTWKRVALSTF